jgi:hypothetical protein
MMVGQNTAPLERMIPDETLWLTVIDTATVTQDGTMTFRFKNGSEVTA